MKKLLIILSFFTVIYAQDSKSVKLETVKKICDSLDKALGANMSNDFDLLEAVNSFTSKEKIKQTFEECKSNNDLLDLKMVYYDERNATKAKYYTFGNVKFIMMSFSTYGFKSLSPYGNNFICIGVKNSKDFLLNFKEELPKWIQKPSLKEFVILHALQVTPKNFGLTDWECFQFVAHDKVFPFYFFSRIVESIVLKDINDELVKRNPNLNSDSLTVMNSLGLVNLKNEVEMISKYQAAFHKIYLKEDLSKMDISEFRSYLLTTYKQKVLKGGHKKFDLLIREIQISN